MKLDEFDSLVVDGSINTDGILKIRDAISELNSTIDGLNNDLESKNNRIKDLQETNSKLYLRVTGQVEQPEVKDNIIPIDDLIKNWRL